MRFHINYIKLRENACYVLAFMTLILISHGHLIFEMILNVIIFRVLNEVKFHNA